MKSRSYGNGSGEAAGPAAEMISVDSWKGGHMGEKDMAEKLLEDYPDVFADIVNVLLFDGKQEVRSEELAESGLRSQFKADSGRMHEEERDVAKYWMKNGRIAALIGLENQTEADGDMPMRLIAYDGSSYKSQILKRNKGERYPVITLVLHFGEGRWKVAEAITERHVSDTVGIAELLRKLSDASVRDCVSDGETVEDVPQRFWNHSRIYCKKKEE